MIIIVYNYEKIIIIYPISAKFGGRMVLLSEYHACVVVGTNHSFGGDSSKTRDPVQASWLCQCFQPDGSRINLS